MPNRKLNGICVLVVDDADDNVTWIRMILELEGATVFAATSASEAIDILQNFIVDVLITELRLSTVDGFELLRMVRDMPSNENANAPAVAMGNATIDDDRALAREAGFAAHVMKPILAEAIVDAVADLVTR